MNQTVGVIGLGAMGAALAAAQIKAGHHTVVWNRTVQKAEALAAIGASIAKTPAALMARSRVILVCVDRCETAEAALRDVWQTDALVRHVVVQLGTTTPVEARRFAGKVEAAGGAALDGAIMFYPDKVGVDGNEPLLVGGSQDGFEIAKPFLQQISSNLVDLGDNVAAAAALDLGLLTTSVSLYAGVAHAARLCEAEGADVGLLANLCVHGPRAQERFEIIAKAAFPLGSLHDGGSMAVWADVARNIHQHATDAGINADLPAFLNSLYRRAVNAGLGGEDVAALVKTLRA